MKRSFPVSFCSCDTIAGYPYGFAGGITYDAGANNLSKILDDHGRQTRRIVAFLWYPAIVSQEQKGTGKERFMTGCERCQNVIIQLFKTKQLQQFENPHQNLLISRISGEIKEMLS